MDALEVVSQTTKGRLRSTDVDLTIVIPCLNEEDNIELILDQVGAVLADQTFEADIVVIDDMSDDRTLLRAEQWAKGPRTSFRISVVQRPMHRRGYGAAVRWWVSHGIGRYCIFVSADAVVCWF